jgi:tetratricopeptide (TPR) repeat protein
MRRYALYGLALLSCQLAAFAAAPDAVILRVQAYIKEGDLTAAEQSLVKALKDFPSDGGLYNLYGIINADRQNLEDAEADFTRAVKLSPHLTGAYLNLARVCEMLSANDPDALNRARHALEQLVPLEPKDPAPLMELARIAEKQQDLKGALAYLAHARDLKPNYAPVHFFFGIVCIELNLPLEAKKSLQKALDLDPNNAPYNYARGAVELQGASGWLAIPYFKKFVAARPDDPRGHFALGVAEFTGHDYEASARQMNLIAGKKETMAGAEYYLGRIAKAESDWEAAAGHFEKSIAADPNYAESHAELGLARMHLKDLAGARKEIDRALELDPDSYIANGNLLALLQRTKDPGVKAQEQKMRELDLKRFKEQELMVRTIKVRQYAD